MSDINYFEWVVVLGILLFWMSLSRFYAGRRMRKMKRDFDKQYISLKQDYDDLYIDAHETRSELRDVRKTLSSLSKPSKKNGVKSDPYARQYKKKKEPTDTTLTDWMSGKDEYETI